MGAFLPAALYRQRQARKTSSPAEFWGHRFVMNRCCSRPRTPKNFPLAGSRTANCMCSMGLNSGIDTEPPWVGRTPLPVQLQKDFFDAVAEGPRRLFRPIQRHSEHRAQARSGEPDLLLLSWHGERASVRQDEIQAHRGQRGGVARTIRAGRSSSSMPAMREISRRFRFIPSGRNSANARQPDSLRHRSRSRRCSLPCSPTLFLHPIQSASRSEEILLNLRRELLAKNNPLGLWYSLQCPLDVKAPEN